MGLGCNCLGFRQLTVLGLWGFGVGVAGFRIRCLGFRVTFVISHLVFRFHPRSWKNAILMPLTKVAGLLQLIILILCSTFLGFTSDLVFRRNQEKEQQLAGGGEGGGLTSEDSRITWFLV